MSQAKANGQNIYNIVTVMDVRIRNLEPGPGKFEKRILILALKVGSHDPILVQLSFQFFLCMMKNVGVHTIQFSRPIIS